MTALPESDRQSEGFALALLMVAPLLMASNPVMGRAAVEFVPPLALAFWRWLLCFIILLPLTWRSLRRHQDVLKQHGGLILLLGALGMGVSGGFVYVGVQYTTATNASIIYAASPVMMLIIATFLDRETIQTRQIVGIVLSLIGVATIIGKGDWQALLAIEFNVGDIWVLGAATSWAFYSVLIRRLSNLVPTFTLFAAIILAGVIVLAPFYLWESATGQTMTLNGATILSLAGVVLIASLFAFTAFQKGIAVIGAARAGPFMYLMPVYGAGLAVLFLSERFELFHAIGLCLILPGVALASLKRRAT